jgi:hypothetical protein
MMNKLKHLLIGPPLPTKQLAHERLNKIRALAAFSPDALSSIAYANQEIYLGLLVAGSAGLLLAWPIGLAIVGPLLDYLDRTDDEHADGQLATVVLPEFVPARWWHSLLHNQTAWLIKAALLYRRRHLGYQRAIVDIPYHLDR